MWKALRADTRKREIDADIETEKGVYKDDGSGTTRTERGGSDRW